MRPFGRRAPGWAATVALATGVLLSPASQAQLKIGQTVGLSGAVAGTVAEARQGAMLCIDDVNARGGVAGERIDLVSMDDQFKPDLAEANARKLIDSGVLALFLTRGTPHNQRILPLLAEAHVPLIGPSTGAMLLHDPVNPWVFNVRSSYQREAQRVIEHFTQIGLRRIAVIQVDDSFGKDAVVGAQRGLTEAKLQAVALQTYNRDKPDFSAVAPAIHEANPQAVLVIGSGTAAIDAIKSLRALKSTAQIATLSNNASSGFVDGLGDLAYGVIVSQVLPSERSMGVPVVKEAITLARAKKISELSPAMLEGYLSAKVLVEGLRRAGPRPTRERLRQALEGMGNYDLGGLEIGYSPSDHTGLDYADLSIIGPGGKFRR